MVVARPLAGTANTFSTPKVGNIEGFIPGARKPVCSVPHRFKSGALKISNRTTLPFSLRSHHLTLQTGAAFVHGRGLPGADEVEIRHLWRGGLRSAGGMKRVAAHQRDRGGFISSDPIIFCSFITLT